MLPIFTSTLKVLCGEPEAPSKPPKTVHRRLFSAQRPELGRVCFDQQRFKGYARNILILLENIFLLPLTNPIFASSFPRTIEEKYACRLQLCSAMSAIL